MPAIAKWNAPIANRCPRRCVAAPSTPRTVPILRGSDIPECGRDPGTDERARARVPRLAFSNFPRRSGQRAQRRFLREGTSCGGVGARRAPLSRLRAGRVCGRADRRWIVIWWYFGVPGRDFYASCVAGRCRGVSLREGK